MKISQVSNSYNIRQNQAQNFKGLWGKTTFLNDRDEAMCIFKNETTYYYYPFLNETPKDIEKVVRDNTFSKIDKENNRFEKKVCKVCATLPFTETQFNEYKKRTLSDGYDEEISRIHRFVQDKYTNSPLNGQESAVNKKINYSGFPYNA